MDSLGTNRVSVLGIFLLAGLVWPGNLPAQERTCPRISPEDYPALLVLEGSSGNSQDLVLITFPDGQPHKQKMLSVDYLQTSQLDDRLLLVETTTSVRRQPHSAGATMLVDLKAGRIHRLQGVEGAATREPLRWHACLRTLPDQRKAALRRWGRPGTPIDILELNLDTLALTKRYTLQGRLAQEFHPRATISPDLRHLAVMSMQSPASQMAQQGAGRATTWTLRILDLETMEVRDLDADVRVEISMLSSHSFGVPPLEWISPREILYQHMPDAAEVPEASGYRREVRCLLKSIDIQTRQVRERVAAMLPLTLDGGSLLRHDLSGRLVYNSQIVNLEKGTLEPGLAPFSVEQDYRARTVTIREGAEELYAGSTTRSDALLSPSRRHLACLLHAEDGGTRILVKLVGREKILDVPLAPGGLTGLVAWLEDTRAVRGTPAGSRP